MDTLLSPGSLGWKLGRDLCTTPHPPVILEHSPMWKLPNLKAAYPLSQFIGLIVATSIFLKHMTFNLDLTYPL